MKRILVTGSRTWRSIKVIEEAIDRVELRYHGQDLTFVHGAATGADTIADQVAKQRGHAVEPHPVTKEDYATYGRYRAPHIRNDRMVKLGADLCLAFIKDNSSGATSTADKAMKAGITVWKYVR